MKLFAVKRYGGAGTRNTNRSHGCIDRQTEKKRLSDLLSKVQKRKENAKKRKELKKKQNAVAKAMKKVSKNVGPEDEKLEDSKIQEKEPSLVSVSSEQKAPQIASNETEGFTVIGKDHFKKVKEVKGVLPRWLANPTIVQVDMKHLNTTIQDATFLCDELKDTLVKNGVSHLFPVQSHVIPWLLQEHRVSLTGYWPRDVCVSAPTGSGKTLAFVLPIIQVLKSRLVPEIRALVVLPVQDLAQQVANVFRKYCIGTNLKVVLASGHRPLHDEQRQLVRNDICGSHVLADIVVTTPGRLVHHLRDTKGLNLRQLRFLVVDEADRVMDGAQSDWLYHLDLHLAGSGGKERAASHQPCQAPELTISSLLSCQPPPQKLLYSATMSHDPEKLAQLGLFQPKLFTCLVKPHKAIDTIAEDEDAAHQEDRLAMPAELREYLIPCPEEGAKPLLLHCLLSARAARHRQKSRTSRTLCFTASRLAAHRLSLLLAVLSEKTVDPLHKLAVAEISAGMRLAEREAILKKFSQGLLDVIVSSDALARGIDIPDIDCVVSYDAPKLSKLYVHRMGRTGRAGHKGTAITLLGPQEQGPFEHMLRSAGKLASIKELATPTEEMEELEQLYLATLADVKKQILIEETTSALTSKDKKTKRSKQTKKRKVKQNKK